MGYDAGGMYTHIDILCDISSHARHDATLIDIPRLVFVVK